MCLGPRLRSRLSLGHKEEVDDARLVMVLVVDDEGRKGHVERTEFCGLSIGERQWVAGIAPRTLTDLEDGDTDESPEGIVRLLAGCPVEEGVSFVEHLGFVRL